MFRVLRWPWFRWTGGTEPPPPRPETLMSTIGVGFATTLDSSTSYALPARAGRIIATATLEVSADNSAWVTLTGSTTGVDVTGAFVRCTTGTAVVVFKPY